ncbi:uncharacterized protein A4U43_C01F30710 [Asparagus officinalis]|uniref:Plant heme peroxidase family profile domain-containing protein n=1 Tax=Asparagus officinalis TaxID=4686 RepID=A0A5P1FTE2_ASPOF|nr:uncharacterized protein A4U43_C01F30710 [Asparagus officinalis]
MLSKRSIDVTAPAGRLGPDITRGYLHKSLSATVEFIVENDNASLLVSSASPELVTFYITQDTQKHQLLPELQIGHFCVTGKISTQCSLADPLSGELTVETSAVPIKSIDIQLLRVESILAGERIISDASVVQTTQIADGDVCRSMTLPIFVLLPRLLVCPTVLAGSFSVEFQVSIVISFQSELAKLYPKSDLRTPRPWGCDASILLETDYNKGITSELLSSRNFGIRNIDSIAKIKSIVEEFCPGQVSCADIIALAAREAVAYSGGPKIVIPLGRKDSTMGSNLRADDELPSASTGVDDAVRIFMGREMSIEETVALLGAHTLGVGHCISIAHRLYNSNVNHRERIDSVFEAYLRLNCPTEVPITNYTFIVSDLTSLIFDNQYYRDVMSGRGLFSIDSDMSMDPRTVPIVRRFAEDQAYFFQVFSSAFVKLSSAVNPEGGEIRRECRRIN